MKGSVKQIKWAEDIRAKFETEAQALIGKNAQADKIISAILGIDESAFWIEYRHFDWKFIFNCLGSNGLRNRGAEFSNLIKYDRASGAIVETWDEDVKYDTGKWCNETRTKIW